MLKNVNNDTKSIKSEITVKTEIRAESVTSIGKVSIIVPVYNGERYLKDCISSILAQTYTDWELLVIDNGSTDRTSDICRYYENLDSRIHCFCQCKRGVSAARNMGLDKASGKYIVFVDADDLLPDTSLQTRVSTIRNADLVVGLVTRVKQEGDSLRIQGKYAVSEGDRKDIPDHWNCEDSLRNIMVNGILGYQGYCFTKLFRKAIIDSYQIRFAEDIMYNEDRLFCVEYVYHCSRVNILMESVYYYRANMSGAMSALANMNDEDCDKYLSDLVAYDRMLKLVKRKYPDCYYLTLAEAWVRIDHLKQAAMSTERRIHCALDRKMLRYTMYAITAPNSIISTKSKIYMMRQAFMGIWKDFRK